MILCERPANERRRIHKMTPVTWVNDYVRWRLMDTKFRVSRLIITYTAGITISPHIDNTQSTGHKSQQDKMHKRVRKAVRSPIDLLVIGGGNSTSVYTLSHTQLMMTSSNGNIFRVTGHLCGKFTGPRWISRTKASDAELWCFLWFTPE